MTWATKSTPANSVDEGVEPLALDSEDQAERPSVTAGSRTHAQRRARQQESLRRAHLKTASGTAPDEEPSLSERVVSTSYTPAQSFLLSEVSREAGLPDSGMLGYLTLAPGNVDDRADQMASNAHLWNKARASGNPRLETKYRRRITELYGASGLEKMQTALNIAGEAGTAPEHYEAESGFTQTDPYNAALHASLKPFARGTLLTESVGAEKLATLDAAYGQLAPDRRAKLDKDVHELETHRFFITGFGQALYDSGADAVALGELAIDYSFDETRRDEINTAVGDLYEAVQDPARRADAIKQIGSALGEGVVEALEKYPEDPAYYNGYIAGTAVSGAGGILALTKVAVKVGGTGDRLLKPDAKADRGMQFGLPERQAADVELGEPLGSGANSTAYALEDGRVAVLLSRFKGGVPVDGASDGLAAQLEYMQRASDVGYDGRPVVPRLDEVLVDGDGRPVGFVGERVPGEKLEVMAREGRLSPEQLQEVRTQITGQQSALHDAGFIHGDPNGGNILVDVAPDGSVQARFIDLEPPDQSFGFDADRTRLDENLSVAEASAQPDRVLKWKTEQQASKAQAALLKRVEGSRTAHEGLIDGTRQLRRSTNEDQLDGLQDVFTVMRGRGESRDLRADDFPQIAKRLREMDAQSVLRDADASDELLQALTDAFGGW